VADLGFIFFVFMPGLVPAMPGLLGPIFWILGLGFTTAANPWRVGRSEEAMASRFSSN
jgi:hypothetical protein